jgi:hypothetical protein
MVSVGVALSFAVLMTGTWISCSPGDVDCAKVSCGGGSGGSGSGGGGGENMRPAGCDSLGVTTPVDFETKFIMTRCGSSMCHQSVFPPRNLNMADKIRAAVVDKKAAALCRSDSYINKANPSKSYLLAKITATDNKVTCPSGGDGGTRMPNKDLMPTIMGDRLTEGEIACFTWWVSEAAAGR